MNRLYNLDYLRGLAAFGIMIYHYLSWSSTKFSADTFMGRLGIYGVSIFYVLSGLTLFYVYHQKMKPSKEDLLSFFKKRIFRIFPLLWLVTIIAILLSRNLPNFKDLFLNLSGLFGFVSWDTYFSPGVWSIGNELVFYVFFPFFIFFIKKFKPLMLLLSIILLALYLYFAFLKLDSHIDLNKQWRMYVNPLNQVFLFLGGFLIGYFFNHLKLKNTIVFTLLLVGLGVFTFYPAEGNTIAIVTGLNRLIFTACCFLVCFCFYKLTFKFPQIIHKPLTLLGETSYSIYLIHPIIWKLTGILIGYLGTHNLYPPRYGKLFFSIAVTLVVSYYVYHYFEKYFMKLGHTKRIKSE